MSARLLKPLILWLSAGGIVAVALVIFPPFRIVCLSETRQAVKTFDPSEYAADFWQNKLTASFASASDAAEVLQAIRSDRRAAKERYGRVVGAGGPHHYYVRGSGRIIAIRDRYVDLALTDEGEIDLVLMIAKIVGNEVLNATAIVTPSQFARTSDYNGVSAAINQIVEGDLVPAFLAKANVGDKLHFVGCSKRVQDDDPVPVPLQVVPVKLEIE